MPILNKNMLDPFTPTSSPTMLVSSIQTLKTVEIKTARRTWHFHYCMQFCSWDICNQSHLIFLGLKSPQVSQKEKSLDLSTVLLLTPWLP